MNKWKIAFFALVFILLSGCGGIVYYLFSPTNDIATLSPRELSADSVFTVQTTADGIETVAKKYLQSRFGNESLPVDVQVNRDIKLSTEVTVFNQNIQVVMHFDPVVDGDGNLRLKQTKMNVGMLSIPPKTTLKLLKQAIDFPAWIEVIPNEEEIFVDLSRMDMAPTSVVRAKEFDLEQNRIILEVLVSAN